MGNYPKGKQKLETDKVGMRFLKDKRDFSRTAKHRIKDKKQPPGGPQVLVPKGNHTGIHKLCGRNHRRQSWQKVRWDQGFITGRWGVVDTGQENRERTQAQQKGLYYRLFLTTVRSHQGRPKKTRKGEGGNWGKLKGKSWAISPQDKGHWHEIQPHLHHTSLSPCLACLSNPAGPMYSLPPPAITKMMYETLQD